MVMKMINKADCEYKGGYIVWGDKIVCVDNEIVDLFNKLDTDVQRSQFERTHKKLEFLEAVNKDHEFVPKSERGAIYPVITADTPELDKMAERAFKIMDEVDSIANADKANDYFDSIHPLIAFVNDEFIVSGEQATQHRFDLPAIGNPLELDKDKLSDFVMSMFE